VYYSYLGNSHFVYIFEIMKNIEKGIERKDEFKLEPKKEKAEKIFSWFNSGLLYKKDLKDWRLDSHSLESEIKDLIARQVRETLKQTDLEMIAESKDFAGRQKTAVYSRPGLDYVIKVVDDISPYRLAERVNINGVGTAFTILKNLECNIKGKPIILPEAVIEIKTTPLEQKLKSLLKKGDLPQAKLLMERFMETVETGWKRGFQFGMDHFLKDYGEEPSGKVTCFDPVIELQKPDLRRDKESIRHSLLALQGLSSEFVESAVDLIEKKFSPETLDKIWKTEEGGRNVFVPNEEVRKRILQFLETKLESEK